MSTLLEHIHRTDEDTIINVDLDKELACGSKFHNIETQWHSGPGEFLVRSPCGNNIRCRRFVEAVQAAGGTCCVTCMVNHDLSTLRIIEL